MGKTPSFGLLLYMFFVFAKELCANAVPCEKAINVPAFIRRGNKNEFRRSCEITISGDSSK